MANELHYQRLVIDAVKSIGGFAFKSSNRHLAGVADLYIVANGLPASYWEVKLDDWPVRKQTVKLDLTPLQRKFLRDNEAGGGVSGVIGFAKAGPMLKMTTLTYDAAESLNYECPIKYYHDLKIGQRTEAVLDLLYNPLGVANA